ncbi:MAG TPA: site-specific integrase [Candidatus Nanoarchaeia archaeon]|nr:site-specific integrase [Candidatus Nanoarchaeia archaeon]
MSVNPQTISSEQQATITTCILAEPRGQQYANAILLTVETGLRAGELASLKWENIECGSFVRVESRAGKRTIPLSPSAVAALSSQRQFTGSSPYVFGGNAPAFVNAARRAFSKAAASTGLKGLRWYSLRHTFACRMVMAGISPIALFDVLGLKARRLV